MEMTGSTPPACSHSHLWNPFCSEIPLSTRITTVVLLIFAAAASYAVYRALSGSEASKKHSEKKTTPSTPPSSSTQQGESKPPLSSSRKSEPQPAITFPPIVSQAIKIHSEDQISRLPDIVGVSIQIIERRAKPNGHKQDEKQKDTGGETVKGYIGAEDSLINTILKNWQQAKANKITHAEIADHLNNIVQIAKKYGSVVSYNYLIRTSDSSKSAAADMQRFLITCVTKKSPDTDIFRPDTAAQEEGASTEEIIITNTTVTGVTIRWTPIRERYIREFGFYALGMEFEKVYHVITGQKPAVS